MTRYHSDMIPTDLCQECDLWDRFWRHCVPTFPLGLGVFAEAFSVPSTFTMYERSWTSTSVGEGVDEMYKTTHWLDILRPTTPPKKEHKLCTWKTVILKGSVFFSTLLKFQASNCLFYGDVLEENCSNCWSPFKQTGNLMPMSSVCFRSHEPWVICSSNSNNKHNKHRQDKEAKTQNKTKKMKLFQRCQPEISFPSIHGYGNDSTTI